MSNLPEDWDNYWHTCHEHEKPVKYHASEYYCPQCVIESEQEESSEDECSEEESSEDE